jgi:hypothetical protein
VCSRPEDQGCSRRMAIAWLAMGGWDMSLPLDM